MSNPPDAWAQLLQLKAMTRTTGVLHSAQVQQLAYYPRIALPHSIKSQALYTAKEVGDTGAVLTAPLIEFKVTVKGKPPEDFDERLKWLDETVKTLLGNDFEVKVIVGKKTIFYARGHGESTNKD